MLDKCFHFNHDPYGCGKLKLTQWNIGDKCDNCTSFIFINWIAFGLSDKKLEKIYWRYMKILNDE